MILFLPQQGIILRNFDYLWNITDLTRSISLPGLNRIVTSLDDLIDYFNMCVQALQHWVLRVRVWVLVQVRVRVRVPVPVPVPVAVMAKTTTRGR
jgi:hypothetical protein